MSLGLKLAFLGALAGVLAGCGDTYKVKEDRPHDRPVVIVDDHRGGDRHDGDRHDDHVVLPETKRVEVIFINRTSERLRIILINEHGEKNPIGHVKPGDELRHVIKRDRDKLPATIRWTADGARGEIRVSSRSPEFERIVIGGDDHRGRGGDHDDGHQRHSGDDDSGHHSGDDDSGHRGGRD